MDNQKIKKQFEEIIAEGLKDTPLPYVQNNSIRIGKVIITPKSDGYRVYDLSTKQDFGKTYSKNAAIAIARQVSSSCYRNLSNILDLDHRLQKYDIDCQFYSNTISNTRDSLRKEITKTRMSDALDRKYGCVEKLNKFIF